MLPGGLAPLPCRPPKSPNPIRTSGFMKLSKPLIAASVLGVSAGAMAQEQRPPSVQVMVAAPFGVPADRPEVKPGATLRESLRHTLSDGEAAGKPYRLSPEERLLLRQQLAGQSLRDNK